ncbi:MAG: DUF2723 domain-containing protein [Anaerolineales bacterium]|nr:DUF2723 domain-containing protein [Anaerolineales bacterium]
MKTKFIAFLLFLAVLGFYLFTMQPSLAWGDGMRLQREVITAESFILAEIVDVEFPPDPFPFARLGVAAWDHPLYVMLGHGLVKGLPQLHNLWLVNLISVVFGAGTIALLFLWLFVNTRSYLASIFAALALAVSHTFWWHSATPEVYTLFAFLLLLTVYWFDLYEHNGRFQHLLLASFTFGLGMANHLLAALLLPALLLYFLLSKKSWHKFPLKFSQLVWLGLVFLLGFAPYWIQLLRMLRTFPLTEILGPAAGETFFRGSLALSPDSLLQSLISYLIFLVYQFNPLGVLLGLYGWWVGRRSYHPLWAKAVALYLVFLIFGLIYQVADQFAFFLSAHLLWAVAMGMGAAYLATAVWPRHRRVLGLVLALSVAIMPLFYALAPDLLRTVGINEVIFGVPQVGTGIRDGLAYYIDPNKRGDTAAYRFGKETLTQLPPDSVVLAEWYVDTDEYFVLRYFIAVEGLRPDVEVIGWPTEDPFSFDNNLAIAKVADKLLLRPVYLASLSRDFYAASTLLETYCIVEEHNLYRIYLRDDEKRACLSASAITN